MCSNGHIPLHDIQRALLRPRNRGRDGIEEDVHSPGHSAHKLHLLARQRQAEALAVANHGNEPAEGSGFGLVRTFTDEMSQRRNVSLSREAGNGALADRLDELEQLKAELAERPAVAAVPVHMRRVCAQCHGDFASFEGGDCAFFSNRVARHSHFMCSLCFGGYILKACREGGSFEQEIKLASGVVVSARGQLPCPFFRFHSGSQLVSLQEHRAAQEPTQDFEAETDPSHSVTVAENATTTEQEQEQGQGHTYVDAMMQCGCGAVPISEIETVLLDPRNSSYQYWRMRHADAIVEANSEVDVGTVTAEWSRKAELLGRGFTPANAHETARLRVALAENRTIAVEMERLQELRKQEQAKQKKADKQQKEKIAAAELRMKVIDALDQGGTILCPKCGVRCVPSPCT